mgnify:FL=1
MKMKERYAGGWSDYQGMFNATQPKAMQMFNPNMHEAWSTSLSQLVNLWRTKFGDVWIDVSEFEEDFWVEASKRLHGANKLEDTNKTSTTPWVKLREDA